MGDYHRSAWPDGLETGSEGLARRIDALNDEMAYAESSGCHADHHAAVTELRARYPTAPLVSFSHFVPRVELSPEKRYVCQMCTPAMRARLSARCACDYKRGVCQVPLLPRSIEGHWIGLSPKTNRAAQAGT